MKFFIQYGRYIYYGLNWVFNWWNFTFYCTIWSAIQDLHWHFWELSLWWIKCAVPTILSVCFWLHQQNHLVFIKLDYLSAQWVPIRSGSYGGCLHRYGCLKSMCLTEINGVSRQRNFDDNTSTDESNMHLIVCNLKHTWYPVQLIDPAISLAVVGLMTMHWLVCQTYISCMADLAWGPHQRWPDGACWPRCLPQV